MSDAFAEEIEALTKKSSGGRQNNMEVRGDRNAHR